MSIYAKQLGKSLVVAALATTVLSATPMWASAASKFGTADEAKTLLTKAVAAVKVNKSQAIDKFNSGADGFKDRDLYVFCTGPDWISTAGPTKGQNVKELKDKNGKLLGQEMMSVAKEGEMAQVQYVWPRPGTTEAIDKVSFVTKVDDQVCGVGYYK
jgi:signal transduction histidine kinase